MALGKTIIYEQASYESYKEVCHGQLHKRDRTFQCIGIYALPYSHYSSVLFLLSRTSHLSFLTLFSSFLLLFIPFISFFNSFLYLYYSNEQTLLEAEMPEWQVLGILELFRMYERQEPFCTESTKVHTATFPSPRLVILTACPSLLLLFYLMIDQWLFAVPSHHHRSSHHIIPSFNS